MRAASLVGVGLCVRATFRRFCPTPVALGKRPEFTRPVVATLRDLVTRLWQHDPALRPPFGDVQRVLDEYRATLTPADYTEDRHSIRMSLHAAQGHPAAEPGPSGGCCTIQ